MLCNINYIKQAQLTLNNDGNLVNYDAPFIVKSLQIDSKEAIDGTVITMKTTINGSVEYDGVNQDVTTMNVTKGIITIMMYDGGTYVAYGQPKLSLSFTGKAHKVLNVDLSGYLQKFN